MDKKYYIKNEIFLIFRKDNGYGYSNLFNFYMINPKGVKHTLGYF